MSSLENKLIGEWGWHRNSKLIAVLNLQANGKYKMRSVLKARLDKIAQAIVGDEDSGSWTAKEQHWGRYKPHLRLYFERSNSTFPIAGSVEPVFRLGQAIKGGEIYFIKSITDEKIVLKEHLSTDSILLVRR
jgi:hypothetical protein